MDLEVNLKDDIETDGVIKLGYLQQHDGLVYPLTHKHTFARLGLVKSNILSVLIKVQTFC